MISIKINGIEYTNVSTAEPSVEYDFYYDVKTMDGKIHRSIKGKRTNYDILFFNINFEEYDNLKRMLLATDMVELSVPDGSDSYKTGTYLVTVSNDELKGKLWGGQYYNTALSVFFEKVGYDDE